jgi:hypothetical protein
VRKLHSPAIFIRSIKTEPMVLLPERVGVGTDRDDALQHVAQVAGDRDLMNRIGDCPFSTQKPAAPRE